LGSNYIKDSRRTSFCKKDLHLKSAIARIVARRSTATKLDGRSVLEAVRNAHPIELAAMTEEEHKLINRLEEKQYGLPL